METAGEYYNDIKHNIFRQRLDLTGQAIAEEPEKQSILKSYFFFIKL